MSKSRFLLFATLALLTIGGGCSESSSDKEANYEDDVKPLIESTDQRKVRGSCNFIDSQSTCVDFVGSVFTEERMKLSCAEGKFSFDACPYSELGGCQATPGTISESIAWSYGSGGSPISVEEAGYQEQACNALQIAKWVKPENLLNQ